MARCCGHYLTRSPSCRHHRLKRTVLRDRKAVMGVQGYMPFLVFGRVGMR